jgi:hypothetical protein
VKSFVCLQYKASNADQCKLSLKLVIKKEKNVTQGEGGRKIAIKCHVLFEWPLGQKKQNKKPAKLHSAELMN